MTPTITYDGVASGVGGNIFQNKRFWVSHRVPQRTRFVNDIQSNGGTVVPLEKNADFLIADHARKDCPPGSFSWRFIEDSVKNGILQLEDRYRIGRDPEAPRPPGSAALGKGKRTPFSTEDDHALVKWVLAQKSNRLGNAIYQEFEAKNPRHTWQSWQNRWKKFLSLLPMARLEQMAETAPSDFQTAPLESSTQAPRTDQRTNHQRAERGEFGKPQALQSPPRAQRPAKTEPAKPQQEARAQEQQDDESEPESSADDDEEEDAKSRFYADLTEYAESRALSIQLQPTIGGKSIELWDLVQAVNTQDAPPEDVDWNEVALDLGFVRSIRDLTTQLQQCWEDNVAGFLDAVAELAEDMEGSDDEEVEAEEAEVPSSPAASSSDRKRSLDEGNEDSSHPKRRRLDPGAEIPSTPDEKLRVWRQHHPEATTPSRTRNVRGQLDEIKDSQDDTQAVLRTPENRKPALKTQESSFDVTPSQQLRFESHLSTSPQARVTFADPGRRDQATSSSEAESTPQPQRQAAVSSPDPQGGSRDRPSARKRPAKPGRRTLPSSFGGTSHTSQPQPQQPRSSRPEQSPDTHDPDNDPDPHPRRDMPKLDTIEGWIEHYQSMGYPLHVVVTALNATTLTPGGLASHVMESIISKQGIPTHHEGVWTDRDDRSLRIVDAIGEMGRDAADAEEHQALRKANREWKRLVNKHGEAAADLRRQYLRAKEEDGSA